MNQPFSPSKVINNRYLVRRVLGQGKFNQTYLAEDTHCFHNTCVIREFTPQIPDPVARQKATELFRCQSEILYKIYHPQLANFREIFRGTQEDQSSIFLVQDYIEGETYQNLLNLRQSQKKLFSEAEVIELLRQLLSLLKFLHEQGIVHCDICPKNIIQRKFDSLPVLIGFNRAKFLTPTLKEAQTIHQISGQPKTYWILSQLKKMAYSSKKQDFPESVSAGRDLSLLGATAVVLLTGKKISPLTEAQQSLEEILPQPSISPQLRDILSKMLAQPPQTRFASAQEVLEALEVVTEKLSTVESAEKQEDATVKVRSVIPSQSNSATPADAQTKPMAAISPTPKKAFWGCLGKLSLFVLLVSISGSLGWLAGKTWLVKMLQPSPSANFSPSDILVSRTPDTRSPSPSVENIPTQQNTVQARRQSLGIDRLLFNNLVDQSLAIQDTSPQNNAVSKEEQWEQAANNLLDKLSLLSPEALQGLGRYGIEQRSNWTRQVNKLHLSSRALTNLVNVRFVKDFPALENQNFIDQPLGQVWYAIAFDTVKLLEAKENYELLVGNSTQTTQQITGKLKPGEGKAYAISLTASKPMEVKLEASPDALLTIYSPTGQEILLDSSRTHQWSGILPESGYYEILVTSKAQEPFDYQLNLSAW